MKPQQTSFFSILFLLLFTAEVFSAGTPDVELKIQWFGQTKDEEWGEKNLGTSTILTIHTHGCALTATSMVLNYYHVKTNPSLLNKWLIENNGFDDGWDDDTGKYLGKVRILWEVPAAKLNEIATYTRVNFRDKPADTDLIKSYLEKDVPVIAEVKRPSGAPHFVVIYGYKGEKFLIKDPLNEKIRYLSDSYNISDRFGSGPERNIYSLRIYEPSGS